MGKPFWKRFRATSRRTAVEASIRYANEVHNRSVERVAELTGMDGHWPIYKWMKSGRIPADKILPFQQACGCTFFTDYLAAATHKLVIDIPAGSRAGSEDMYALQQHLNDTVGHLLRYHDEPSDDLADLALSAIRAAMEDLAYHKINIEKQHQPELSLFGD
ncbi:MAG: hypothetical protein KZQ76_11855 [Candidatus Thiodiazotropha sp. (ex Epidulcina cf. delphinae)]|nr:hypothetical protein [Candidatus Thiodiazotropha sp. (ex Epidulcina cf. delphinae)]